MKQVYKAKALPEGPYRALHVSDIHMSNGLPHAKIVRDGVTDRMLDQQALWNRIFDTAREHKCEAIFVQGDLFDNSKLDPITLMESLRALALAPVDIYFIGGNHDGVNTRGERFSVEALDVMDRFHYMETGEVFRPRDWLSFWPLEFATLPKNRKSISDMKLRRRDTNVLLMHNSIVGCTHVGWTCDDGLSAAEVCRGFDHVLSGHFHDPQEFGKNGRFLGAPMHHHYGDVGRRAGYWVMEWTPDGERKETFFDGGCPKFHNLDWDDIDGDGDIPIVVNKGDYVWLRVRCTSAEMTKLKTAVIGYCEVMSEAGLRMKWTHDPVYHHTRRLAADDDVQGAMTPEAMVDAYVDAVEVNTTGLDLKELKSLGRDILREVRGQWLD